MFINVNRLNEGAKIIIYSVISFFSVSGLGQLDKKLSQ